VRVCVVRVHVANVRPWVTIDAYQEEKEVEELVKLERAREVVRQEILKIRNRYEFYDEQCQELRGDIKLLATQGE